jgi:hypothetical protein
MSSLRCNQFVAGHPADHRPSAMHGGARSVAVLDGLVCLRRAFTTRGPNWLHNNIYILDEDRLTRGMEIDRRRAASGPIRAEVS